MDDVQGQQDFDDFFEEVFTELEDKVTVHSVQAPRWQYPCLRARVLSLYSVVNQT